MFRVSFQWNGISGFGKKQVSQDGGASSRVSRRVSHIQPRFQTRLGIFGWGFTAHREMIMTRWKAIRHIKDRPFTELHPSACVIVMCSAPQSQILVDTANLHARPVMTGDDDDDMTCVGPSSGTWMNWKPKIDRWVARFSAALSCLPRICAVPSATY